eukprot:scaffold11374_cov50-Cyclotella_meneghiniana.AAC.4
MMRCETADALGEACPILTLEYRKNPPEAYRSIAYFGSANSEESLLASLLTWRIFPKLTARSLILDPSTPRSPN